MFNKVRFTLISLLLLTSLVTANETDGVDEQIATEEIVQEEIVIPENSTDEEEGSGIPPEAQTTEPEISEQDEISQAQKEADAAEAAELREVGEGEEPLIE